MTEKKYLEKSYNLSLFSDDDLNGGIADGILSSEKQNFKEPLLKIWKNQTKKTESQTVVPEKIFNLDSAGNNEAYLVALTNSYESKINVAGVYNSSFFDIPEDLQFVIYLCIFISLFLILFLIFSFKRDSMTILKKKVKKLQLEIMQDCFEKGESVKLDSVFQKLSERRNEISTEILKSLKIRSKKQSQEIESLLEKNWDEIFAFFKSQQNLQTEQNVSNLNAEFLQEIKSLLQEVLQNTELKTVSAAAPQVEKFETVEEIEEIVDESESENEGLSPLEELSSLEQAELETELEELEELTEDDDTVEENENKGLSLLEEVGDDTEGLSPFEELPSLEQAEPETELEELTPLEEIPVIIPKVFNTEFLLKNQPKYEYTPSDSTYFASENFATVDNVFAEEICLGSGIKIKDESIPIDFKYYELKKYFEKPTENKKALEQQTENQTLLKQQVENQIAPEQQNITNKKDTQSSKTEDLLNEIEDLSEEVPMSKENQYFSMTDFAENLTDETPILDAADIPENAIIEEDGIFSISQIKDYEKMGQDKDFKSLVDSIL